MRIPVGHSDRHDAHMSGASYFWKPPADQPQNVHPSVSAPPSASAPSEPSALATAIGGDAYATGTSTEAGGVVSNTIKDMGNVTIASGYAIFEATGTSPTHGGASADADTFLAVTGADIVVEFTFDHTVKLGNTVVAVSETRYIAIDIENWAPRNGPLVIDYQLHSPNQTNGHNTHLPDYAPPSGALATVAAFAEAHGANTAATTLTHSLAVENQFSLVSGLAIVAA